MCDIPAVLCKECAQRWGVLTAESLTFVLRLPLCVSGVRTGQDRLLHQDSDGGVWKCRLPDPLWYVWSLSVIMDQMMVCPPAGIPQNNTVPLHELARSWCPLLIRLHPGYDRTNERIPRQRRRPHMCSLQVCGPATDPRVGRSLSLREHKEQLLIFTSNFFPPPLSLFSDSREWFMRLPVGLWESAVRMHNRWSGLNTAQKHYNHTLTWCLQTQFGSAPKPQFIL